MAKVSILKLVMHFPVKVADVLVFGRRVADKLDGNKLVPTTRIPIPTLRTDLDTLQAKEAAAKRGGAGAADDRDTALGVVKGDLETLLGDVNLTMQQNPTKAAAIADSSGFDAPKEATRAHQPAKVRFPKTPGEAQVFLEGLGKDPFLHWQIREVNTPTWIDGGMTTVANQIFPGLVQGKTYEVQWRLTKVRTTTPFSASFSFLMH